MELTHRETDDLLRRILAAVDKDPRNHWVEVTCAIILSLATTGSAWCAYQSSRWNGVQNFRLVAASKAGRESSESTVLAMQGRAFDAAMFINYIEAKKGGNKDMEDFLHRRLRPEMRLAVDAWLKTDPFNNQNAPPTPFAMAEYVQMEQQKAKRQDDLAAAEEDAAQEANRHSDTYVLLTVIFASVLFFGGIGGTFSAWRLRLVLGLIALILFLATMVVLSTMPICHE